MSEGGRPSTSPRLDHLLKDRRGLPVPYINAWGDESPERMRIDFDRRVGMRAAFYDDHGDVPDFTRQAVQRQRECMVDGLCQVCARPVPWSRRFLVVAAMSVDMVQVDGVGLVAAVSEPWLDERCALIATRWCPDLIRRRRGERLQLIRVRSAGQVQLTTGTGWIEGPLEEETKRDPVAMYVRAILVGVRIDLVEPVAGGG